MKMTMVLDPASLAKLRQAPLTLKAGMAQIAQDGQKDAYQLAVVGAQAGIYGTVPGRVYVRKGVYLQSIFATGVVNASGIELNVGDRAPYAQALEYGLRGTLPQAAAEQMAAALGTTPGSLYLGRTGRAYTKANPAITRAAVYSGLRMMNNLEGLIRFATR